MRILTVRQPWAWALIHGGKDVENRLRNIAGDYRGPVAIHAGLARFEDQGQYWEVQRAVVSEINGWAASDGEVWSADGLEADDPRFVYGAIIGTVNLYAVHPDRDNGNCCPRRPSGGPGRSPWAERDTWHLCVNNPQALADPIPYKGALGLRTLDPATAEQITTALAAQMKEQ